MPVSKKRYKKRGKKRNPEKKRSSIVMQVNRSLTEDDITDMTGSTLLVHIDNEKGLDDYSIRKLASAYGVDPGEFKNAYDTNSNDIQSLIKESLRKSEEDGIQAHFKVATEYYGELIKIYGKSYDELMSMNVIDVQNLVSLLADKTVYSDELFDKFIVDTKSFYDMVPCFSKGVLVKTDQSYIEWELLSIDEENKSYKVHLMHYCRARGVWEPGISCTTDIKRVKDDTDDLIYAAEIEIDYSTAMVYSDIYSIIPMNHFDWTDKEKDVFKATVLNNAEKIEKEIEGMSTSPLIQMIMSFTQNIAGFNFALSVSRPRRKSKNTSNSDTVYLDNLDPKRKVRYVGTVSVVSEKEPQVITSKTVEKALISGTSIRYKVPMWEQRGHIRHLRNGKTTYVKPCIKHRKNYDGSFTEENIPAKFLRVREGKISCEEDNTDT